MLVELFENLRNGNVEPKEALRIHIRFKSELNEIKIGGNISKDQKDAMKILQFFWFAGRSH